MAPKLSRRLKQAKQASLALCLLAFALPLTAAADDDIGSSARTVWSAHVEQIFADHCTKCHAGVKQKGGVDLRTPQTVLKGGDDGPIVIPGNAKDSKLFKALRVDSDPHMPPEGSKQLTEEEVAIIQRWIEKLPSTNQPAGPIDWRSSAYAASEPVKVPAWAARMEVSRAVDRFIEEGWKKRKVKPAAPASDPTFVRRIYLDLIGRIPTEAEVAKFDALPKKTRREQLIDELLGSKEFATYMSEIFDVVFLDRTAPTGFKKDGTPRASRGLRRRDEQWGEFLETAFAKNRPWNEIVRAIILARPEKPEDKGAEYYLYSRRDNFQGMAEAIAPIAFGVSVKCAQCHNHPLAPEVEQRHYWGLVAAFNRSKPYDGGGGRGESESAIGGFVNFADLRKRTLPAALIFPNGKYVEEKRPGENEKEEDSADKYVKAANEKSEGPKVPKFSRREELAKAATQDNPALARVFVNRVWAMLMGRGLVHPVDALDSRHPASHPELLEVLAKDFSAHGYDTKRVFRELLLTRTYQLDSKGGTPTAPPESFAHALDKPLPAEALHRSLLVALSGKSDAKEGAEIRDALVERFPDLFPAEYSATLHQAMFLSNNQKLDELLQPGKDNTTAAAIAEKTPEAEAKFLFKRLYNRAPEKDELAQCVGFLKDRPADKAVPELLWTLIASAEFQFNH